MFDSVKQNIFQDFAIIVADVVLTVFSECYVTRHHRGGLVVAVVVLFASSPRRIMHGCPRVRRCCVCCRRHCRHGLFAGSRGRKERCVKNSVATSLFQQDRLKKSKRIKASYVLNYIGDKSQV